MEPTLKNKIKSWFLKINKIGTFLQNEPKENREKQINIIRDLKVDIKTNSREIHGIIRECFEILHSKTMENLLIINKFLDTCPTKIQKKNVQTA